MSPLHVYEKTARPTSIIDLESKKDHGPAPVGKLLAPDFYGHLRSKFVTLDAVRVTEWENRGGKWKAKSRASSRVQAMCVDVDGAHTAPQIQQNLRKAIAEQVSDALRANSIFSGTVAVTTTSTRGLQVVVDLAKDWDPKWRETAHYHRIHDELDELVMEIVLLHGYLGGHADPNMRTNLRYIRVPGWRVEKRTDDLFLAEAYVHQRGQNE